MQQIHDLCSPRPPDGEMLFSEFLIDGSNHFLLLAARTQLMPRNIQNEAKGLDFMGIEGGDKLLTTFPELLQCPRNQPCHFRIVVPQWRLSAPD